MHGLDYIVAQLQHRTASETAATIAWILS